MSTFKFTRQPIGHGHAAPPYSFILLLVRWGRAEDESVFAPNNHDDIYGYLKPTLAPEGWLSPLHRRAAMLEAMRVIAGDESDWDWKEGRDTTAKLTAPENQEAGAFQVSYDSRHLGPELSLFLIAHGIHNAEQFQTKMKSEPTLEMAYAARLLRDSTRWDGPLNRGWVRDQVNPDAVQEFMELLSENV